MIEVKISTDMPLPTPRSVMSSPSHMITAVPAVSVSDQDEDPEQALVRDDRLAGSCGNSRPERASAMMPVDCSTASATVR